MNSSVLLLMIFAPMLLGFLPVFVKNTKIINTVMVVCAVAELALCIYLLLTYNTTDAQVIAIPWFAGMGIGIKITGFGILQAVATSLIWVGSSVFSDEYFDHAPRNLRRYYVFWSITFGATLGMFLANDLFTVFIFFEIMSFASYPLVVHNQDDASIKAGNSYLSIAVIGGLVTLTGIFILDHFAGTVVIDEIAAAVAGFEDADRLFIVAFLIFFGFAAKAGMFPLNGWLPKAHPAAPAPASAALSGILIKTGIFGAIVVTSRVMQGNEKWAMMVLVIGIITMFLGALCAFMSVNLKETLAYSSMSQIGFIVIGVAMTQMLGEHGTIAAYGTVLHMINHTMIKLVLFTCAGIVYQNTHSLNLNEIQGFGKGKKVLTLCFGTAALGIMGVPFFNGYISKTLLHEAIVEKIHLLHDVHAATGFFQSAEVIFLISGGFTVAYMTKLFICLFVKNPTKEWHIHKAYVSGKTSVVISIVAVVIFVFGALPHNTMDKLAAISSEFMGVHPLEHEVAYFSWVNLKGAVISLAIGSVLYFVVAQFTVITKDKKYINPWNQNICVENLIWKPLIFKLLPFVLGFIGRVIDKFTDVFLLVFRKIFMRNAKIPYTFFEGKKTHKEEGIPDMAFHVTESLAYSLLLFGVGFVIMVIYLFVA
ncbi:MAG: sodium:proton antiporter [Ruminococcaceae bacterium]|nr:sodium:proton antiporter [Oscillospiraceae bacterium]